MFRNNHQTGGLLLVLCAAPPIALAQGSPSTPEAVTTTLEQKADGVFAAWSKGGTPGCALGVVRDGKLIHSRGFGLADVEHEVPISPATVFHVASVSKQFTAMAIYLLAQENRLSLDDDVRKHLPELHDFGKVITIRHLLHHTSGLRDQWDLLSLAGWRLEDVITEQDILDLIWRQEELNFEPGRQHLYSNTGYTLLGVIVKRVSGKSLREFADARMFKPLGMSHTHFQENYWYLVKDRAFSYLPQPGGSYRGIALSYSNAGATSLFTTVEDLARWDENFYTGQVGGNDLLAQMQVKGVLNDGEQVSYASGLVLGEYRGVKTVDHAGGDAGFRTEILRFPDQHFSVITLCNAGEANAVRLAQNVADAYLEGTLAAAPAEPARTDAKPKEVKINPDVLHAYVGDYQFRPGFILTVSRTGPNLTTQATGQPMFTVFPASERSFFPKEFEALLTFDPPGKDKKSPAVTIRQGGRDLRATRIERVRPTAQQLQAYSGTYFSDELNTLYFVTVRGESLFLRYPRGELGLQPLLKDEFGTMYPVNTVKFTCAAADKCAELSVTTGRVGHLRFRKVSL